MKVYPWGDDSDRIIGNSDLVLYSSDFETHHHPQVITLAGTTPGSGTTKSGAGSTSVTSTSGVGLTINVGWDSSVAAAPVGFKNVVLNVAQYFVDHFSDPVTLNIKVGYGEAGGYSLGGSLGMSLTYLQSSSYTQIKTALAADQSSAADTAAVTSLLGDPTVGGHYWMSTAEAKAIGLLTSTTNTDGFVGFSSSANIFDYDNTNGISSGQYDFFAVVAHEFSEVMGRMLLVGGSIGSTSNSYDPLDLFHYSAPGTHSLSGTLAGYFSADSGTTNLHNFNASPLGGDRGDWASSAIPDAFDAFGTPGVIEPISAADLTALDILGWNSGSAAPPPAALPDLTISNLAFSNAGTGVSFQLNNIGTTTTGASNPAASVYLSADSIITNSDTLLGSATELSVNAAASMSESVSITLAAQVSAAVYYIGVIADSTGSIAEADETNNMSDVLRVMLGTNSADALTGTSGNDFIMGFDGNDTITGGAGADTLIGGSGADHFRYTAQMDGMDTIVDFMPGSDVLDFSRLAFGTLKKVPSLTIGTLDLTHFASNADGHATAATAQFLYNTTSHILSFDPDGTAAMSAIQIALLGNSVFLSNTDIHII